MKIALIGNKPAYPKVDGGCVASAAFLQNLVDAGCEVHYLTLSTSKHPFIAEKFPVSLAEKVTIEAISIDTSIRLGSALKHLFSKKSYNVERFYSREFAALIESRCAEEQFDAVIFDNVFSARYLAIPKQRNIPCYVRSHNVEFQIWSMLAKETRNPLKKWYLKHLSSDLKRFELRTLKSVDGIFSITQNDLFVFKSYGIDVPAIVTPLSLSLPEYTHNYGNSGLFHLGSMHWSPNIETVNRVLQLLPEIRKKVPACHFTIAGNGSDVHYPNLTQEGVSVLGYVDSIPEFLQEQGILISPTVSGSGVRVKILEMMAYGVPIISSTLGAQGIADKSGIYIADTDNEIKKAVYELSTDENKRRELGNKAKSVISLQYDPQKISEQILEFLQRT